MSNILKVYEARIAVLKSFPPQWSVKAEGVVATTGWRNPRLEPRFYIDFPKDGIQDFDFVADPPPGIANQVLSPVTAYVDWENPSKEIRGIRVHSANNAVEVYAADSRDLATVTMTESDAIVHLNSILSTSAVNEPNATGACVYTAGGKTYCAVVSKAYCDTLKGAWVENGKCS
jgi:hypothetical protein